MCLLLEKAEKQFDCQWFYPEVRSLMAMTLFNRGIHDHPWVMELKSLCDEGTLPGLLGFEALHLLKPDSDEYKARAKAYGFPGLLPENAPEMPAWERMLDRWICSEKEAKAKIESSARTASLSRIVYRLDCDNWSLKPRLVQGARRGASELQKRRRRHDEAGLGRGGVRSGGVGRHGAQGRSRPRQAGRTPGRL